MTCILCSGTPSIAFFRDLFFPDKVMNYFPGDHTYMVFTQVRVKTRAHVWFCRRLQRASSRCLASSPFQAYLHSPPASHDDASTPLYVGDLLLSQRCALSFLLCSLFKIVTPFLTRRGNYYPPSHPYIYASSPTYASGVLVPTLTEGESKLIATYRLHFVHSLCVWMIGYRFFHVAAETQGFDGTHWIIVAAWETFNVGVHGFM